SRSTPPAPPRPAPSAEDPNCGLLPPPHRLRQPHVRCPFRRQNSRRRSTSPMLSIPLLRGRCRRSTIGLHRITSWTNQYGATQKALALCTALCDYFRVHGSGSSSFPIADTFLHSPPMVESCAVPKAALFCACTPQWAHHCVNGHSRSGNGRRMGCIAQSHFLMMTCFPRLWARRSSPPEIDRPLRMLFA